jgi:hypothetical protein
MRSVEDLIDGYDVGQRELMGHLHKLLVLELDLQPRIRFNIPFYYRKSWILYMNPIKGDRVELAFVRGNELDDTDHLLDSKGRRQVHGLELHGIRDIPQKPLIALIQQAILLDMQVPYASKRKRTR